MNSLKIVLAQGPITSVPVQASDDPDWRLTLPYIQAVHAEITRDLETDDNRAGRFRDNPKTRPTVVGSEEHGGVYRPPQLDRDIQWRRLPLC